jgi:hypothetical protein
MNKSLLYSHFVGGMIFGLLSFCVLQRVDYSQPGKILFVALFAVLFFLWRWMETRLHIHYFNIWERIRPNGRFNFIFVRYILLRGIVLSILFIVPSLSQIDIRTILLFIVLIIIITTMLGTQEWTDCENKYQARLLRDAATSLRTMQN